MALCDIAKWPRNRDTTTLWHRETEGSEFTVESGKRDLAAKLLSS